ncbi:MAG: 5-formyltetrahydrofolate cyclo-ligase [Pseudomonadales bacterium]|nr:5-formyltetrahydrofolate cyclo-ligase [Pseudomonadales bacterium]
MTDNPSASNPAEPPLAEPNSLRKSLRQARRALSPRQQQLASRQLFHSLSKLLPFRRARRIAFYLPIDGEVDPRPLLTQALQSGKKCYLPVIDPVNARRLRFVHICANTRLYLKQWGIAEPRPTAHRLCPAWALDLVLVPLTGFDAQGNRLGMGKGFYDRSFQFRQAGTDRANGRRKRPLLIGVAHECQRVARLHPSPWDIGMDLIVSDARVYYPRDT